MHKLYGRKYLFIVALVGIFEWKFLENFFDETRLMDNFVGQSDFKSLYAIILLKNNF